MEHGRRFLSLGMLGAAALSFLPACSERETRPCLYEVPAGRIEGTVRLGTTPITGTVRATRLPLDGQNEAIIEAVPDAETGAYSLDVPAGRYIVSYAYDSFYGRAYDYRRSGLSYGDLPPDTLRVNDPLEPQVADFLLATLRAHLSLSPLLDDESAEVLLYAADEGEPESGLSHGGHGSGRIEGGEADVVLCGILPGDYKIEIVLGRRAYLCDCRYDGEHFWIPGVRDSSAASWTTVPVDGAVDLSVAIDPVPGRIEGRVAGAWLELGLGVPPTIALVDTDSILVMGARQIEDDGHFGVDIFFPRPVKILIEQQGIGQWIGGADFHEAQVFPLARGQTGSGIELVQSGLSLAIDASATADFSSIRVRLYDADTHVLAADWQPRIYPFNGSAIKISNLRPGLYLLYLDADTQRYLHQGWLPQWFDRVREPEEAQRLVIALEGEVVALPIVLERGGAILGTVEDDADPPANFFVFITRADDPAGWGRTSVYTLSRDFRIYGLPDGDWRIGAWRRRTMQDYPDEPPSDTIWYPGTSDWEAAAIISTRQFEEVSGIEIDVSGR